MGRIAAITLLAFSCASVLHAWESKEHIDIGAQAYFEACETLIAIHGESSDPRIRQRLSLACTQYRYATTRMMHQEKQARGMYVYEPVAGEWSALAGDHVDTPRQLTSVRLGDAVVDFRRFAQRVVQNYRHFHPAVVTSWREHHFESLEAARRAAAAGGLNEVVEFESALALQAFAQHFLQDSFASGHMGFNRVASSNAAAMVFHDTASRTGRCVKNDFGAIWMTYGDGRLLQKNIEERRRDAEKAKAERNRAAKGNTAEETASEEREDEEEMPDPLPESARYVVAAATSSLTDFLTTFVTGEIDTTRWQTTWGMLPSTVRPATGSAEQTCDGEFTMEPLRIVGRAAASVSTLDVTSVSDFTLHSDGSTMHGVMVGASRELWYLPLGYRTLLTRGFLMVGSSLREREGDHAFLVDFGYLVHVGTSARGTLTHEVGFGEQLYFASGGHRHASLRLLYAVSIEAGRRYIRAQTGLAKGYDRWGPHVSIGVGIVQRSRR